MPGGTGTGILITASCFCCCFESFEEVDVPRARPSRITRKSVSEIIENAKIKLLQSHTNCKKRLVFGLLESGSSSFDFSRIRRTLEWAKKIMEK